MSEVVILPNATSADLLLSLPSIMAFSTFSRAEDLLNAFFFFFSFFFFLLVGRSVIYIHMDTFVS